MMNNKIVGITCSTFDLLHTGHIIMLEECKKHCDYLICALQNDPTIDRKEKITNPISCRKILAIGCG